MSFLVTLPWNRKTLLAHWCARSLYTAYTNYNRSKQSYRRHATGKELLLVAGTTGSVVWLIYDTFLPDTCSFANVAAKLNNLIVEVFYKLVEIALCANNNTWAPQHLAGPTFKCFCQLCIHEMNYIHSWWIQLWLNVLFWLYVHSTCTTPCYPPQVTPVTRPCSNNCFHCIIFLVVSLVTISPFMTTLLGKHAIWRGMLLYHS